MADGQQAKVLPLMFWWIVAATALVLVLGYIHAAAIALRLPPPGGDLFDLNTEANLPAWFAMLLLFAVAASMLRAAQLEFRLGYRTAWGWLILGLGFIYLGIDERLGLHERLDVFEMGPGIFHHGWVLVAIPGLVVLALGFIPFLRRVPRPTAIRLIVAGIVFVLGSVVIEMIGGVLASSEADVALYFAEVCIEESLEMIGVVLALRCVLLHIRGLAASPSPGGQGTS